MANGILKHLNQSLEPALRDSLDNLEEFTLMMAYASTGEQFDILSVERVPAPTILNNVVNLHPTKLHLVNADSVDDNAETDSACVNYYRSKNHRA